MFKMLKSQNPDKEYPPNIGQKWTDEEELLLLDELNKNIDIELIAKTHNRTTGGINARRREIAFKLYNNNISIEEIINKTKLDKDQVMKTLQKRQTNTEIKQPLSIESEIYEIKNDIKELKNTLKQLVEMMKAVYEFENT